MPVSQTIIIERLAHELGIAHTNHQIASLELEAVQKELEEKDELVKALQARIINQDADMRVLREEVVTLRPKENIPPSQRPKSKR